MLIWVEYEKSFITSDLGVCGGLLAKFLVNIKKTEAKGDSLSLLKLI